MPSILDKSRRLAMTAAVLATLPLAWLIIEVVDQAALAMAFQSLLDQPVGLVVALLAFASAFMVRGVAWSRILPDLALGQSVAALHVSLAGNHLLPLRMGEPLRVVSVVRRAGIDWGRAVASTLTLRAADFLTLLTLGLVAGLASFTGALAWLLVAGAVLASVAGGVWLTRLRSKGDVAMPGPVALSATAVAWLLESIVMWQAADWAGIDLAPRAALLVTAAAVTAQLVAFAPGGFGTYEAGGTTALVFLGHDPGAALAAVLTAHAVKTAYALLAGPMAAMLPAPSLFGHFRLRIGSPAPASLPEPGPEQPVVLFMPAHNEEAIVATVVSRVPPVVAGRPVLCLVIDDGSTDATAAEASQAGATVVSLPANQGLGAAVRRGLAESLALEPAAVAFCDADGEYAPEELERLVGPILDGEADYVVGSRFAGEIERMLPHRRLGNRVLTVVLSWVARRRIGDGQSGYRAFSPRAAAAAEVIHDFNYAQVITLDLLAKGMRYHEIPISYRFRTTGRSFVRLGRYLRAVIPAVYRELNTA